jgi:hypothetical protein
LLLVWDHVNTDGFQGCCATSHMQNSFLLRSFTRYRNPDLNNTWKNAKEKYSAYTSVCNPGWVIQRCLLLSLTVRIRKQLIFFSFLKREKGKTKNMFSYLFVFVWGGREVDKQKTRDCFEDTKRPSRKIHLTIVKWCIVDILVASSIQLYLRLRKISADLITILNCNEWVKRP